MTQSPFVAGDSRSSRQYLGFDIHSALTLLIGLVLAGASAVLYVVTCAPGVLYGDGGEFQFVPYILGIAHPTGYPLYILLGWAWSHLLTFGDVAYRMNLFSVFWAVLAVGMSFPLNLRFMRRAAPLLDPVAAYLCAATASASLAVGLTFWSQAIIAEIYSLNAFFVILVLWLTLRLVDTASNTRGGWGWSGGLVLCFVLGLSLTHHRTMLLLLPGILIFLWLSNFRSTPITRESIDGIEVARSRLVVWLSLLVAFLAPLMLYLYLPLRAPFVPYTTLHLSDAQTLTLYDNSWTGLADYVAARVFAANLGTPAGGVDAVNWGQRLFLVAGLLRQQFGWAGMVLALIGLGRLVVGRRWRLLALTVVCYALTIVFNVLYFIGDVQVLFIPSYVFFSLWLGLGVATVVQAAVAGCSRIQHRAMASEERSTRLSKSSCPVLAWGLAALSLALPALLLTSHLPLVDQSTNRSAEKTWSPILDHPIPFNAVLLSNDRDEIMSMWYYQYVEGKRPDLMGLFPGIVTKSSYADIGGLIDQSLSSRRSVYLIKSMPGLEVKAQLKPNQAMPPLVEVTGPALAASPVYTSQVTLDGTMRLVGYDRSPTSPQPGQAITITLYWQPQVELDRNYTSFVHLVDENGHGIAQNDHMVGGEYYPTSLWRPGEVLLDRHVLTAPDSMPVGIYQILAGMYSYPSLEPLGAPIGIGLVAVKDPADVQTSPPENLPNATGSVFGGRITLLGFDWQLNGNDLQLTFFWQAERTIRQDWTVALHLVSEDGRTIAIYDGQPRDGRYPTSVWDVGEVVDDSRDISLPNHAQNVTYQLAVGLYALPNQELLPVQDSTEQPVGNTVNLLDLNFRDETWQARPVGP